jgi:hypothetical protein
MIQIFKIKFLYVNYNITDNAEFVKRREVEPANKGNTLGLEKYKKADKLPIIVYLISSGRSKIKITVFLFY